MKNLNLEKIEDIFKEFALSSEEMIRVKGGDQGEPIILPSCPPPKL